MKTIEEKRLDFLEDTVKYYSEDVSRRAVVNTVGIKECRCLYRTKDGKKCAIGRFIPDEKYFSGMEGMCLSNYNLYENIDKEIRNLNNHDGSFLKAIQTLHDIENFWSAKGLTKEGKEKVISIKKLYCK